MFNEQADEDLMVMYQKGEVRAFEVLLSRHRKPVYNFILRFVGDRETAEDLLQEAFMRVIKGAEAYKRQAKFTTWLYTIARNLCVDQTRRRKHRKHASLDAPMDASEESGTLMDVIPGNEMASDRKSVNKQLHEQMQRAIAALSEEQREVFLMREFLDMPFKQIADVVGVPENTVKSRMRYALEKLRLELDEYKDLGEGRAVTDHDEPDDEQLRSLRAVWLSLPDEEPPPRGIAELMAAASIKAEQMAQPSWWQRITSLLRRPAVLALATVMVLIGGAVIIGRRGDSLQAPAPAVDQNRAMTPAASGSAASPAEGAAPIEVADPSVAGGAARADESAPAKTLVPAKPSALTTAKHSAPVTSRNLERPRAPDRAAPQLPRPRTDNTQRDKLEQEAQSERPGVIVGAQDVDRGGEKAKETATAGAAPAREHADAPVTSRPSQPSISQSFSQARTAATRGDCASVRAITGRIAKQDAQYYRNVVVKDATIHKCITAAVE